MFSINKRLLNNLKLVISSNAYRCSSQFVPKHNPAQGKDIENLEKFLENKSSVLVLTGAGVSTESGKWTSKYSLNTTSQSFFFTGIPDYRSEGVGLYARNGHRPVQHMEFIQSAKMRQRYWARNFVAWPSFSNFQPNATHLALSRLQREGRIHNVVTQNVDRLHTKAGTKDVVELHGSGYNVICVGSACDYSIDRHEFQLILNSMNENMVNRSDLIRPDGDVDIPLKYIESFKVPECPQCGGILKPEIVFFGDSVPKQRAERLSQLICSSDGIMILGSSLLVYSGYRVLLYGHEFGTPIAIVNIGDVRGQDKADLKISAKCGDVIPKLFTKQE